MTMGRIVAAAGLVLLAAGASGEWTQWRGPDRTGVARAPVTARWPKALARAWSVEVGEGHSGPLLAGGRVYVHARAGGEEVIAAHALADGRRLWAHRHPVDYTPTPAAAGHGAGPKSTPLLHGGRLFAFGAGGALTALDAATGRVAWRRDFAARFPSAWPLYGVAQSPVADGDRVLVHAGGSEGSALLALDAATGAERWAWTAQAPAYASPMVATIGGVRQVVTLTERQLVGLSAAEGKLLWSFPFETMYEQNAVTPVVHGDLVIVSGIEKGVTALRIRAQAGRWEARPEWTSADASFYMSSPVRTGGRLLGFSHRQKGQLVALDAASGRLLWTGPGRAGESASIVVAGEDALVLTTEGELLVAGAGAERFTPIATYTVSDAAVWAHLAVAPGVIAVKDARMLTVWRTP
jgi:outer membrane protein assembly factor BamB